MASNFSSDGFDLDAVPKVGSGSEDVIFELGGSATTEKPEETVNAHDVEISPIARAEELKAQGNEAFKIKNYLEAHDMYSSAIDATPGVKGDEILKLRDEFEDRETAKLYERQRMRRQPKPSEGEPNSDDNKVDEEPKQDFEAPSHPYGFQLAIYHCNRAACRLHLDLFDEAVKDSDIAILLRPDWAKAYIRRSTAFEKLDSTDRALADAKKALELDTKNQQVRSTVKRLQKIEDERLERLKEETIGKLKDLGNSILGNFGLSLDNFQAKQDASGSYSINFDQSKGN